jgi:DNA-binding LytR/AlgR family response regulator
MKISCIIVDDEPASREILEKYVHDCPNLNLVHICKNAFEANDVVSTQNIQLIFLDINMPMLSGMMFYKSLTNPPYVIFTTAYPEFAVEGFEVNAVDYLLKPFPFERFLKSVNKATELINSKKKEPVNSEFILLKSDKKIHRIMINDIFYLEAIGDYVRVFYDDKNIVVHDTFQNILKMLPAGQFIRIHKSYAVSINKFESIEGNRVKINTRSIPVGQTYKHEFIEFIKKRSNS